MALTAPQVATRIVAILEIVIAAMLALMCAGFVYQLMFPGEHPPPDQGGWAALGLALITPICLAFALAGITLLKSVRGRWLLQLIPAAAVAWVLIFYT